MKVTKKEMPSKWKPTTSIYSGHDYEDEKIVVANIVARCINSWNEDETILFYTAVSQLTGKTNTRGEYESRISKTGLKKILKSDPKQKWLSYLVDKLIEDSKVTLYSDDGKQWEKGVLINGSRWDSRTLYIYFNPAYVPLLMHVKAYYTKFQLGSLSALKGGRGGEAAMRLFVYLVSWANLKKTGIQHRAIMKGDLQGVFGLNEGEYWRNWGTDQQRFDWASFEQKVISPAIEKINKAAYEGECDIEIKNVVKLKEGLYVCGYEFEFVVIPEDEKEQYKMLSEKFGSMNDDLSQQTKASARSTLNDVSYMNEDLPF